MALTPLLKEDEKLARVVVATAMAMVEVRTAEKGLIEVAERRIIFFF